MSDKILTNLLRKIDQPNLLERLTNSLTQSELNSQLLAIYKNRSKSITPAMLLESYQNNRFVRPSSLDPLGLM